MDNLHKHSLVVMSLKQSALRQDYKMQEIQESII